jgi:hypothetical protein
MNTEYTVDPLYNGGLIAAGIEDLIRKFKGEIEITFNLKDISEGDYEIINITVDFNDNTPLYIREYNFNENIGALPIKHKFKPSLNTYNIIYYPTIYITFSNFKRFIYQTPILIAQESFYTKYQNLNIANSQFIDNIENSMFVTFDTEYGDILNLKIK